MDVRTAQGIPPPPPINTLAFLETTQDRLTSLSRQLRSIRGKLVGFGPEPGNSIQELPEHSVQYHMKEITETLNDLEGLTEFISSAVGSSNKDATPANNKGYATVGR